MSRGEGEVGENTWPLLRRLLDCDETRVRLRTSSLRELLADWDRLRAENDELRNERKAAIAFATDCRVRMETGERIRDEQREHIVRLSESLRKLSQRVRELERGAR
jgi:hypothetical protein